MYAFLFYYYIAMFIFDVDCCTFANSTYADTSQRFTTNVFSSFFCCPGGKCAKSYLVKGVTDLQLYKTKIFNAALMKRLEGKSASSFLKNDLSPIRTSLISNFKMNLFIKPGGG